MSFQHSKWVYLQVSSALDNLSRMVQLQDRWRFGLDNWFDNLPDCMSEMASTFDNNDEVKLGMLPYLEGPQKWLKYICDNVVYYGSTSSTESKRREWVIYFTVNGTQFGLLFKVKPDINFGDDDGPLTGSWTLFYQDESECECIQCEKRFIDGVISVVKVRSIIRLSGAKRYTF